MVVKLILSFIFLMFVCHFIVSVLGVIGIPVAAFTAAFIGWNTHDWIFNDDSI